MASTRPLPHRPRTPSPHYRSSTLTIPPTPSLSDSTGSDESPMLVTPCRQPIDRNLPHETDRTLCGVCEDLDYGELEKEDSGMVHLQKTYRGRRASDAGVVGRRDSIFADDVSTNDSIGNLSTLADSARPTVDEAIKGIPQGWEDDMSIAVPSTPIRHLPPTTMPNKTPRNIGRLTSLRALPQKGNPIAAWRGRKVSNAQQPVPPTRRQTRASARSTHGLAQDMDNIPAPARARLGLFAVPPAVETAKQGSARITKLRRPVDDSYLARSVSSSSSLTTPTVITARTSISHDTAFRSTIEGEQDASDYTPSLPARQSATSELERRHTMFTTSTTSLPSSLVETPATENARYAPSIASQESSRSNRDRVLGLVSPTSTTASTAPKAYRQPELHEVLPFAAGRPFSAWDVATSQFAPRVRKPSLAGVGVDRIQAEHAGARLQRRSSLPSRQTPPKSREGQLSRVSSVYHTKPETKQKRPEGWDRTGHGKLGKGKMVWLDGNGDKVAPHYLLGWERDVLDLEARLHQTVQELAGDQQTFASFPDAQQPETVLDIGTGSGAWPISQSLIWPKSRFVGLDIVPIQTDLQALAQAEQTARATSSGTADGEGAWGSIAKRVSWDRTNFLDGLPYDSGVFSFVHVRFLALGVPETKWAELLDESVRVLAPGGTLEIVEMGITLPSSLPNVAKEAFAKCLLAEMIHPNPSLPIKFALPTVEGLVHSTIAKPVYERTWKLPPDLTRDTKADEAGQVSDALPASLAEAGATWMASVLSYGRQSRGGVRKQEASFGLAGEDVSMRVGRMADGKLLEQLRAGLVREGGTRWDFGSVAVDSEVAEKSSVVPGERTLGRGGVEDTEIKLWAWVGRKKA